MPTDFGAKARYTRIWMMEKREDMLWSGKGG